jgi:hypothetical protein
MKKAIAIIITILVIVSFNYPKKERYFFVSWASPDANGSQGVITQGGRFINFQEIVNHLTKDDNVEFYKKDINILGIYEFKNQSEMEYFFKGRPQARER